MKKVIFFDIDGTLIDCMNGHMCISDKVGKAIKKFQSEGGYAFISTGRPYAFLYEEIKKFGFDGFVLANGAAIMIDDRVVYKEAFDKKFIKELIEELEKFDIEYILEGEHYSYLRDDADKMKEFYRSIGIDKSMLCSDYNVDKLDVLKVEMFCNSKAIEEICIDIMNRNPKYSYYHSIDAITFEVCRRDVTKASGIDKVLQYLGIKKEDSFAFGDGTNDIEMLSEVGCGIAMGNASDYVKSFANIVTDTVGNDGVAKGIYEYILE